MCIRTLSTYLADYTCYSGQNLSLVSFTSSYHTTFRHEFLIFNALNTIYLQLIYSILLNWLFNFIFQATSVLSDDLKSPDQDEELGYMKEDGAVEVDGKDNEWNMSET